VVADRWITDTPISARYAFYTRANAGEVLPHPCSPLGWTLVFEPGVVLGWYDCLLRIGTCDADEMEPWEVVGVFGGYLYINAALARLFGVRAPGLTVELVDLTYFGDHPDVPPYVAAPWHERPAATERLGAWMSRVLGATDLPELRDDQAEAAAVRAARPDLRSVPDEVLVERARSLQGVVRRMFDRHLEMTAATSIGAGVLGAIARALGDPAIALQLITSVGDVDSTLPSHAMWALSRLEPAGEDHRRGVAELVERFGSRGPDEWDIRSPTWETNPELVGVLVEVMRKVGDDDEPATRNLANAATRAAVADRVRDALAGDAETTAQFEAALRSSQLYMAGRERSKTTIIKVVHEVRMAMWELAARHGFTPSEVCMLLADELDAFIADPEELRARLTGRQEQFLGLFELEPPFIVDGVVPPLTAWRRRDEHDADTPGGVSPGDVLHGVPGCPGTATGTARVILDPADPLALEPGEILVAPITDPAWTPLFVPAAAVIVEVGAQVSHAVIVSRELGIPCVVSVQHATRRIANGTKLSVDGTTGTITVL
jgi:phosphohistidine swiveling domain-containing protein